MAVKLTQFRGVQVVLKKPSTTQTPLHRSAYRWRYVSKLVYGEGMVLSRAVFVFAALAAINISGITFASPPDAAHVSGDALVKEKIAQARSGNIDEKFVQELVSLTDFNMRLKQYSIAIHTAEPLGTL